MKPTFAAVAYRRGATVLVALLPLPFQATLRKRLRHHRLEAHRRQPPRMHLRLDDPRVPGVTCHVSQARTGGVAGSFGLAEDPSQFSLASPPGRADHPTRQTSKDEVVFSGTPPSLQGKPRLRASTITRRNVLVYLAISRKIIEGAPVNAISTVPRATLGRQMRVSGHRNPPPRYPTSAAN